MYASWLPSAYTIENQNPRSQMFPITVPAGNPERDAFLTDEG